MQPRLLSGGNGRLLLGESISLIHNPAEYCHRRRLLQFFHSAKIQRLSNLESTDHTWPRNATWPGTILLYWFFVGDESREPQAKVVGK